MGRACVLLIFPRDLGGSAVESGRSVGRGGDVDAIATVCTCRTKEYLSHSRRCSFFPFPHDSVSYDDSTVTWLSVYNHICRTVGVYIYLLNRCRLHASIIFCFIVKVRDSDRPLDPPTTYVILPGLDVYWGSARLVDWACLPHVRRKVQSYFHCNK
jgi:hypothetical protein